MATLTHQPTLPPTVEQFAREVTRRILTLAQPQRILLFGSSLREGWSVESDLDILVIMRGAVHRRQLAQKIYRGLHGVGVAVDIVVVTEDDVRLYGENGSMVLGSALQEGYILYDAG